MDGKKKFHNLLEKYLSNRCSAKEVEALFKMLQNNVADRMLYRHLEENLKPEQDLSDNLEEGASSRIEAHLKRHITFKGGTERKYGYKKWIAIAAAAVVFLVFSITILQLSKSDINKDEHLVTSQKVVEDINPGTNKAYLTLSDGSHVILNNAQNGILSRDGQTVIKKQKDGQVVYQPSVEDVMEIHVNTITTPKGGEYQIILPDGTKVWLNADSKLSFPTAFSGTERKVELSGEAYFEVAKNKHKPFRVKTTSADIEVLGTEFNVKAYKDDSDFIATLLGGAIKLSTLHKDLYLKPGQQVAIPAGTGIPRINMVDTEETIAWKNGYFMFTRENIQSIMQKIARWYDVDIVYQGDVKDKIFWGSISRYKNVSEVLNMLELTGSVHFKIEGRRIIVKP